MVFHGVNSNVRNRKVGELAHPKWAVREISSESVVWRTRFAISVCGFFRSYAAVCQSWPRGPIAEASRAQTSQEVTATSRRQGRQCATSMGSLLVVVAATRSRPSSSTRAVTYRAVWRW
jgi:hypothetical protein